MDWLCFGCVLICSAPPKMFLENTSEIVNCLCLVAGNRERSAKQGVMASSIREQAGQT